MPIRVAATSALVALALSAAPVQAHAVHIDHKVTESELVVVA